MITDTFGYLFALRALLICAIVAAFTAAAFIVANIRNVVFQRRARREAARAVARARIPHLEAHHA